MSPSASRDLAELCRERLGWSKTTTYTVIKRLSERGVVKNENTVVTSLVSKDEAQVSKLNELMEKRFENSLPAFIAAFAKRQKLSEEDIDALRRIIDKGGAWRHADHGYG